MKKINVIYNLYGYIDEVSDNSIHFEQENESLQINATIETDKKVRAYIKAPNNNSTITDELTSVEDVYSCVVDGDYMAKGTLYIGYELYDDTGYIERLEPLKIYIDSFVNLGGGSSDNVYVVSLAVGDVKTLANGEPATVENAGTKKDMILNFGLPRGEQGIKGDKGDKGDKGEKGERGEPFGYEDFTAEQLEALRGPQGIQGEQGIQGVPGTDGKDGADGYTPIKGVDYFTAEDIKSLGIDDKVEIIDFNLLSEDVVYLQDTTKFELSNKVDKVDGKGLSSNDFTDEEKTKLSGIEEGATKTIVDSKLSATSTNPLQNKVLTAEMSKIKKLCFNYYHEFYNGDDFEEFLNTLTNEGLHLIYYYGSDDEYSNYYILTVEMLIYSDEDSGCDYVQSLLNLNTGEVKKRSDINQDWQKISVSQTDLDRAIKNLEKKIEAITAS